MNNWKRGDPPAPPPPQYPGRRYPRWLQRLLAPFADEVLVLQNRALVARLLEAKDEIATLRKEVRT